MLRKISFALSVISAIAMFLAVAVFMPEIVPHHYNINFVADRWGSKWLYAFFVLIPLFLSLAYEFYRKHINDRNGNKSVEDRIIPLLSLFFIAVFWIITPFTGSETMRPSKACLIFVMIGLIMLIFSNYNGKIRQNPYIGIRIRWTLKNETVWKKTHRLGGYTGSLGGIIMILFSFIGYFSVKSCFAWCISGLIVGLIFLGVIPAIYSFILYRKISPQAKH